MVQVKTGNDDFVDSELPLGSRGDLQVSGIFFTDLVDTENQDDNGEEVAFYLLLSVIQGDIEAAPAFKAALDALYSGGGGGFTEEQIEDFVALLIDDNSVLDWTYVDVSDSLVAIIKPGAVTDTEISGPIDITKLDVNPLSRANHSGSQAISTITDLQSTLDAKALDSAVVHDTGDETVAGIKTFSNDPIIPDEAYGVGWNGLLEPTTKNAVYDKIELLATETKTLTNKTLEDTGAIEQNVNTVAATGSTETLDVSAFGIHDCTMDQACTFTFSNPAPSGDCSIFVLILRGAFTPTLPSSVDWSDGAPPTYTTPSIYTFTTVDGGTTWMGAQVGKAFA